MENCNCPDFNRRHREEEGFYCKHLFAAMLYSIKHPEVEVIERPRRESRELSRCAGCGIPSGKPSEGGSTLSGKGPGKPLYCMDCNPSFMGNRQDVAATLDRMAATMEVA